MITDRELFGRSASAVRRPSGGSFRGTPGAARGRGISSSTSTTASPATSRCSRRGASGEHTRPRSRCEPIHVPVATGSSCRSSRLPGRAATPVGEHPALVGSANGSRAYDSAGHEGRRRPGRGAPRALPRPAGAEGPLRALTRPGRPRWRPPSRTRRRSTSSRPRGTRPTWSRAGRWIACSAKRRCWLRQDRGGDPAAFKAVGTATRGRLRADDRCWRNSTNHVPERFSRVPVASRCSAGCPAPPAASEGSSATAAGDGRHRIGTHRLLQGVQFRQRGAVIIDEEQRFGVAHKEAAEGHAARWTSLTLSPRRSANAQPGTAPSGNLDSDIETPPEGVAADPDPRRRRRQARRDAIGELVPRGGRVFLRPQPGHTIDGPGPSAYSARAGGSGVWSGTPDAEGS